MRLEKSKIRFMAFVSSCESINSCRIGRIGVPRLTLFGTQKIPLMMNAVASASKYAFQSNPVFKYLENLAIFFQLYKSQEVQLLQSTRHLGFSGRMFFSLVSNCGTPFVTGW